MKPLVLVVYDRGSAGPLEIAAAARGVCDVVFVCDPAAAHVAGALPALRSAAPVVDAGSDPGAVARAVAPLRPAGITTFSEYRIGLTAGVAARLGLDYHDPGTALALGDKLHQRRALDRAGLPGPRHREAADAAALADAAARLGFPAVVKPRRGAGSASTYRVAGPADVADIASRAVPAGGYLVEELLEGDPAAAGPGWGDYVSVESVVAAGEVRHVAVMGKFPLAEPFRETGQFVPATLPRDLAGRAEELAGAALRALGVRSGCAHTELKLTPDGPRIIEVNGRVGGNVAALLRRASGYDLLRAALGAAAGPAPPDDPPDFRRIAFRRYLPAPPRRAALRRLGGIERIAALPGVDQVDVRAEPGQVLDWRNGTQDCVGLVQGTASDHAELRSLAAEIDALLETEFTVLDGEAVGTR
ncbi:ATP-grasp domain-containing protein [Actinomadura chibensis]|uniref:ATP-grasp domain-containing protein n=1 Tax=Actinomadura chibensis TaxID=392828 RepID=A0A5D0NE28_9ACTN|nr:ATP-grasp domain-containing protein [Actinomadura chibensis]TYB42784.1 ATP-grasp domain-containing protein [Actinomadura chibensis]